MKNTQDYLKTTLNAIREHPGDLTPEQLSGLWSPAREARDVYVAAIDAYDADLAARRAVLEGQATQLDAQLAELEKQIAALESESREAASRGDLDAAAEAGEQADNLRKQAATLHRKRRIASSAELRGDRGLYEKLTAARASYDTTYQLCAVAAREAADDVRDLSERLERLTRTAQLSAGRGPQVCGADRKRAAAIDAAFVQS